MNEYVLKDRRRLEFVNSIKLSERKINVEFGNKEDLAIVFTNLKNACCARELAFHPYSHEIVVALRTLKLGTYHYRELN